MKLELASLNDAQCILNLELSSLSNLYHGYDSINDLIDLIQKRQIYMIYVDEKSSIGHIICSDRGEFYYIEGLVIEKKYRNKGYGKSAIKMIVDIFQDKDIKLVVHPENVAAIISYLKNGFIVIGYEINKFGDGEDRVVMRREVNS